MLTLITNNPTSGDLSQDREEEQPTQTVNSLWATCIFDEKVTRATSHKNDGTDAFLEVKRYFETRNIERKVIHCYGGKKMGLSFLMLCKLQVNTLQFRDHQFHQGNSSPKQVNWYPRGETSLNPRTWTQFFFLNKNLAWLYSDYLILSIVIIINFY